MFESYRGQKNIGGHLKYDISRNKAGKYYRLYIVKKMSLKYTQIGNVAKKSQGKNVAKIYRIENVAKITGEHFCR